MVPYCYILFDFTFGLIVKSLILHLQYQVLYFLCMEYIFWKK